jgi:aryl-alcohol dehydrogenase-like predicted oxidoreductase
MNQRPLGSSGVFVPELGFNLCALARTGLGAVPDAEALELIRRALDRGVTLFSASPHDAEGRALSLLGRALAGEAAAVTVALRLGRCPEGTRRFDAAQLSQDLAAALAALRRPKLELLLLERPPAGALPAVAAACAALAAEGRVQAWGASVDSLESGRAWLAAPGLACLELAFHAADRSLAPLIAEAAAAGKGVLVRSPLDQGWLAGTRREPGLFSLPVPGMSVEQEHAAWARAQALAGLVPPGLSVAQAALQFVLGEPGVSAALPSPRNAQQLDYAVAAAAAGLDPALAARIRALA